MSTTMTPAVIAALSAVLAGVALALASCLARRWWPLLLAIAAVLVGSGCTLLRLTPPA